MRWGVSGLEPRPEGKYHFCFPSKVKAVTHARSTRATATRLPRARRQLRDIPPQHGWASGSPSPARSAFPPAASEAGRARRRSGAASS